MEFTLTKGKKVKHYTHISTTKYDVIYDVEKKESIYCTVDKIEEIKTNKNTFLLKFKNSKELEIFELTAMDDLREKEYFVLKEINGVYEAINEKGKVGLLNQNMEVLAPFEYDSFKASNNKMFEENSSKLFITLEQNGKFGIFNTVDKKMILPAKYNGFILNGKVDSDSYVTEYEKGKQDFLPNKENQLYRFLFTNKEGKVGVVNSKNHIVLNPILTVYEDGNIKSNSGKNGDKWEYTKFYYKKSAKAFDEDEILLSMANPNLVADLNNEVVKDNYLSDNSDLNSNLEDDVM